MATYQKKGAGVNLPYAFGMVSPTLRERIDIPGLIALGVYGGLALVATPDVGVALPSTGFADGDILNMWGVVKGTLVNEVGVYVITGEGATCTIDVGVQSATQTENGMDIDGAGVFNLETSLVLDGTAHTDGWGSDALPLGELYITNGSIDIEWNHDATGVAEFEIWCDCKYIGDLTANA